MERIQEQNRQVFERGGTSKRTEERLLQLRAEHIRFPKQAPSLVDLCMEKIEQIIVSRECGQRAREKLMQNLVKIDHCFTCIENEEQICQDMQSSGWVLELSLFSPWKLCLYWISLRAVSPLMF